MNSKTKINSEGMVQQDIDVPGEDFIQAVTSREMVADGSVKNLEGEVLENIDFYNNPAR